MVQNEGSQIVIVSHAESNPGRVAICRLYRTDENARDNAELIARAVNQFEALNRIAEIAAALELCRDINETEAQMLCLNKALKTLQAINQ